MSKIPKRILQVWIGDRDESQKDNVPQKWQRAVLESIKMAQGWEHTLLTTTKARHFVANQFPDLLETYDDFPHNVQRADLVRYLWLYMYGGVYFDLDMQLVRPLDGLFDNGNDMYAIKSLNSPYFLNGFFACTPKLLFWKRVVDEIKKGAPSYAMGQHLSVMLTTGPMMITRVIEQSRDLNLHVLDTRQVYPFTVCMQDAEWSHGAQNANSYFVPVNAQSHWNGLDSKLVNTIWCKRTFFIALACVVIMLKLLLSVSA